MDIPSVEPLVSLALFLIPGMITLVLASIICGSNFGKRSELETIVLSVAFSLMSLLVSGVPLSIEEVVIRIRSPSTILMILLNSAILGIIIGGLAVACLHLSGFFSSASQRIGAWMKISYMSYEKGCAYYVLNNVLREGKGNQIIVENASGSMFKGFLGGFSESPLEIILIQDDDIPLMKFTMTQWYPLKESIMVFVDEQIGRISVVKNSIDD